jgi:osmotically-inducible protein OsmY
MTTKNWWCPTLGCAFGLVLLLGTSASARSPGDWPSDAWITTKAKVALLTADDVNAMDVHVDTINGRVALHGKVPDQKAKLAAVAAVRKIEGVQEVADLLQVVKPAAQKQVDVEDAVIEHEVEKALSLRKSLQDSDILVESVNSGVVLLKGQASVEDQLEAIQTTAARPGVTRVASHMVDSTGETAPGAMAMAEGAKAEPPRAGGATQATRNAVEETAADVGGTVQDAWITTKVKTRLLADRKTPALDVNVDTHEES